MVKIIYLDIDGTLRDERTGITNAVKAALSACRKKGIYIVICTGRNLGSIQEDVMALETDGIISGGGCHIQMLGKQLKAEHFSENLLGQMLELIQTRSLGASLEGERVMYMNQEAAEFYQEDFEKKVRGYPQAEQTRRRNGIRYADNLNHLRKEPAAIHKLCLISTEENIKTAQKLLGPMTQTVQKRRWNDRWYLELLPEGCEKGSAVRMINQRLSIKKQESMSFGDGENDLEMFQATGIRVAVKGGSPRLKAYADSVCEEPSEDGISKELKRRGIL